VRFAEVTNTRFVVGDRPTGGVVFANTAIDWRSADL
jgi:hypothetical protein